MDYGKYRYEIQKKEKGEAEESEDRNRKVRLSLVSKTIVSKPNYIGQI